MGEYHLSCLVCMFNFCVHHEGKKDKWSGIVLPTRMTQMKSRQGQVRSKPGDYIYN